MEYFNKGACRKMSGVYVFDESNNDYVKTGAWRWYWKNGKVMDIGIYNHGILLHRTRFSKKGVKLFENHY